MGRGKRERREMGFWRRGRVFVGNRRQETELRPFFFFPGVGWRWRDGVFCENINIYIEGGVLGKVRREAISLKRGFEFGRGCRKDVDGKEKDSLCRLLVVHCIQLSREREDVGVRFGSTCICFISGGDHQLLFFHGFPVLSWRGS